MRKFSFPWKIDAKLRVQLIATEGILVQPLTVCVYHLNWLLYSTVSQLTEFSLLLCVLITKTDDGSFNCHVDIVNFSSFGFLILTTQNFLRLNNYNIAHLRGL